MATYATLTIPVADIIGAEFNASRASVWIEPNIPVVLADSIRVGGRREQVVNGVATFANLVTTNSADNPASFGYRVTITAPPKGAQKREDIVVMTTADFPFTATANLKDIPEAWDNVVIPVEWRSEFRDEMEAVRDATVTDRAFIEARVVDDLGTTDGQTKALIETPSSQTATALATTYAAGADTVAAAGSIAATGGATLWPFFVDRKGALLRGSGADLQKSTDNGATWATIWSNAQGPTAVRQLDSGELLIATGDNYPTNTIKSKLWLTSGYESGGTVTATLKITASDYQQTLGLGWGFGGAGSTYAVSEYDSKAPGSRSANSRAWLTTNSGVSWTQIYDHGNGSPSSRHIHGVAYDQYRDAIWLTLGDYTGTAAGDRRIRVSWNHGSTWTDVSTDQQPTAIMVFPDCVAFGSDNAPNGILRIANPSPTNLVLTSAYRINQKTTLTHVAESPFRAKTPEGHLTLLPFTSAATGYSGLVLGSYDGFTWFEVWRDSRVYGSNKGPKIAVGPTRAGKILIAGNDEPSGSFAVEVPASSAPGVLGTASRLSKGVTRAMGRRSVIGVNRATTAQTYTAYTEVTLNLNPTPLYEDDVSDLFTPATDGITVNRDCWVEFQAANGISPAAYANLHQIYITLDGVGATDRDFGPRMTGFIRVAAGQKVGVKVNPMAYNGTATGGLGLALMAWEQHV